MNASALAIDTTGEFGSLALVHGNVVLEELPLHAPENYDRILFGELDRLLKRHSWTLHQVDCFVAASGPGSFTGVRVCLAAAKGLAEVTGKPVVTVSNLKALASFGCRPYRLVVQDARRGEVYAAVYTEQLDPLIPETVLPFPALIHSVTRSQLVDIAQLEFLSPQLNLFEPALRGTPLEKIPRQQTPRFLAAALGLLGLKIFTEGKGQKPEEVDANYVRRADAELKWADRL